MTRNVCFAALTILMLLIKTSVTATTTTKAIPATPTTNANLGDDMMKASQPVVVPTSSAVYLITSGAKMTKASETTRATSNNMETGSEITGASFSGIATSTSNISSITDDADQDNVTNMFTTGTHVTPGNGIVTPRNGTADAEQPLKGHAESKGSLDLAALFVGVLVAVRCS